MNKTAASDVLARLHAVFGVKSDSELASAIGVNRQTLGSWRSRNAAPYALCVNLALEKGVSLDWLLIGTGRMRREPGQYGPADLTPREEAVLGVLKQLPEGDQIEVQHAAEDKRRLREIEQRLEELAAAVAAIRALRTVPKKN